MCSDTYTSRPSERYVGKCARSSSGEMGVVTLPTYLSDGRLVYVRYVGKCARSSSGEMGVVTLPVRGSITRTRDCVPDENAIWSPRGDHAAAWQAKVHCWRSSLASVSVSCCAPEPSRRTI